MRTHAGQQWRWGLGLFLPQGAGELIFQRLAQVGERRPYAVLDEGFNRHAGHQRLAVELGEFARVEADAGDVVSRAGLRVFGQVGRDPRQRAVELGVTAASNALKRSLADCPT